MTCSVVLCLSLSNATQAVESMEPEPCADRKGGQSDLVKCNEDTRLGIDTIKGELSRVERDTYFIKQYDGKESSLHIDQTTQKTGDFQQGDRIEAKVKVKIRITRCRFVGTNNEM